MYEYQIFVRYITMWQGQAWARIMNVIQWLNPFLLFCLEKCQSSPQLFLSLKQISNSSYKGILQDRSGLRILKVAHIICWTKYVIAEHILMAVKVRKAFCTYLQDLTNLCHVNWKSLKVDNSAILRQFWCHSWDSHKHLQEAKNLICFFQLDVNYTQEAFSSKSALRLHTFMEDFHRLQKGFGWVLVSTTMSQKVQYEWSY